MTEETTHLPPLTRAALCRLAEQGDLSATAWKEALAYLGFRPDAGKWGDFWRQVLLLSGVLFLAAGSIFFIAVNWAEMHRFTRLALVQGLVACTALAAVWRGLDSLSGRLCLLACGVCIGPMLAVFGQCYQTGADQWELFRVWACVLVALAIVGHQAALWLTAWIVSSLFVMLYMSNSFTQPEAFFSAFPVLPEYLLAQTLGLVIWEAAARVTHGNARYAWLHARWLPRLFFFSVMDCLTICLGSILAFGDFDLWDIGILYLPSEPTYWLLYAFCVGGSWLWYRRRRPDLFMLACAVGSLATLFVALLIRAQLFFHETVFALYAWGMIIVGLTWAVGKILLYLQRQMVQEAGRANAAAEEQAGLISASADVARWSDLWAYLRVRGLVAQETPPLLSAVSTPWYVQVMLAFGGWVAALFFVSFLGLLLYTTLGLRNEFEGPLLLVGIALMGVAWYCLRARSFFARRFGFAVALAGSAAAVGPLCLLADSLRHCALLAALPLVAGIVFLRSSSYRFLAALCVSVLGSLWLGSFFYEDALEYRYGAATLSVPPGPVAEYFLLAANTAWWAAVACAIALICTREDSWRCSPRGRSAAELFIPLAFGAFTGLAVMVVFALGVHFGDMFGLLLAMSARAAGMGAGIGLVCLVSCMVEATGRSGKHWALLALATMLVLLGWYHPGVSVALFGMALARYMASPVMLGATGFFLFVYMVYYYYYLSLTLMHKSLTLITVGGVLLLAGLASKALTKRFASGEASHA